MEEDRPKGDMESFHLSDIPEKAKRISRDRNQVGAAGGWSTITGTLRGDGSFCVLTVAVTQLDAFVTQDGAVKRVDLTDVGYIPISLA